MYKIIGADGKEYGPVTLEQLRQWQAQGRIGPQTRVQEVGAADWKTAAEIPALQNLLRPSQPLGGSVPGTLGALGGAEPQKGLAVTSFVLGILSLICLGPFAGLPAVITGHMAHGRARRAPQEYGGAGFAIAGLVMGYLGIFLTLVVLPAMLLPALAKAKGKAQEINCVNNLKQIGLAVKIWAVDHNDQFPFQASTNAGGSLELASQAADGTDKNSHLHFKLLAQELSTPRILVCPADKGKKAAMSFEELTPANVTYLLRTGESVTETNVSEVMAICPIHGNTALVDGSVQRGSKSGGGRRN